MGFKDAGEGPAPAIGYWFWLVTGIGYAVVGLGLNPSWFAPGMDHRTGMALWIGSWALARTFRYRSK